MATALRRRRPTRGFLEWLSGTGMDLPFSSVQLDGGRIAWVEAGNPTGEPIVLVHGLAASGWWWERNLAGLGARHRLLVVDMAGFGASRRQWFRLDTIAGLLAAWLDAIGVRRTAVIGHSLGGHVAADLAATRPDLVDRLVLVDAAALPLEGSIPGHVRNLLRGGGRSERRLLRIAVADILRAGPLVILRAGRELLAADLSDHLPRIAAPTLVVWGDGDALIPPAAGRRLAGTIPGATFAIVPDAGHAPMWERPDLFDRLVLDFLDTTGGPPTP
jgi:pimeloyl-ACP methyl ester carboxylesterase